MKEKALVDMEVFIINYKRKRRLNRKEPRMLKTLKISKFKRFIISRKEWRDGK